MSVLWHNGQQQPQLLIKHHVGVYVCVCLVLNSETKEKEINILYYVMYVYTVFTNR